MNLSTTAIKKKTTAHLLFHLIIHLFKKHLFNGCYMSGTKVNKTDETCNHRICSSSHRPPPPKKFGNHRPRLNLAITFYILQYRNQSFSFLGNQHPQNVYEILSKAAVDHSSSPVVFPDLQIANELSGYFFFCHLPPAT